MKDIADFDRSGLGAFREDRFDELLRTQPELFTNHLAIARQTEAWADGLKQDSPAGLDPKFVDGFVEALRQVAVFLRQGSYMPDGEFLHQVRADMPDGSERQVPDEPFDPSQI